MTRFILCTVTAAPLAAQAQSFDSTPESVVWQGEDVWKPDAFDQSVPIGEPPRTKVGEARPGIGTVLLGSTAAWTMGAVAGADLGQALTSNSDGLGAFLGGLAGAGLGAALGDRRRLVIEPTVRIHPGYYFLPAPQVGLAVNLNL